MNDFIKLHPKNYKEVSDKVIFILMSKKFLKTILRVFSKNFELVKH